MSITAFSILTCSFLIFAPRNGRIYTLSLFFLQSGPLRTEFQKGLKEREAAGESEQARLCSCFCKPKRRIQERLNRPSPSARRAWQVRLNKEIQLTSCKPLMSRGSLTVIQKERTHLLRVECWLQLCPFWPVRAHLFGEPRTPRTGSQTERKFFLSLLSCVLYIFVSCFGSSAKFGAEDSTASLWCASFSGGEAREMIDFSRERDPCRSQKRSVSGTGLNEPNMGSSPEHGLINLPCKILNTVRRSGLVPKRPETHSRNSVFTKLKTHLNAAALNKKQFFIRDAVPILGEFLSAQ